LSDTTPSDAEADVAFILRVAVPVPLLQVFDYLPPPDAAMPPAVGCRVAVPFGRSRRVGIIVDVAQDSELPRDRLKPVIEILDSRPLLTAELLDTLRWTARYYQHPLGEVLQAALPTGLRRAREAADAGERALILSGVTAAVRGPRSYWTCSPAGR
jgi:primosomal protein N' (replication factor Y) (superfamily II helicase)